MHGDGDDEDEDADADDNSGAVMARMMVVVVTTMMMIIITTALRLCGPMFRSMLLAQGCGRSGLRETRPLTYGNYFTELTGDVLSRALSTLHYEWIYLQLLCLYNFICSFTWSVKSASARRPELQKLIR